LKLRILLILASLFLSALPYLADAAPKSAKNGQETAQPLDDTQDITIPMASHELQAEVQAEQAQRERANAPKTQVQLGASSWKPGSLVLPSRFPTTSFTTTDLPTLSISLFSPLSSIWTAEVGVSFMTMRREGTISSSGLNIRQEQNAYVNTVRLGGMYAPWSLWGDKVRPYASAAILPTMVVTRSSSFGEGVSEMGVPMELGAGALIKVSQPISVDLGISQTFGKVQDSDMSGFAVRAGVRVPI
jgi:opacity protein-like surface antigen